jgi:hypothetical protein
VQISAKNGNMREREKEREREPPQKIMSLKQ